MTSIIKVIGTLRYTVYYLPSALKTLGQGQARLGMETSRKTLEDCTFAIKQKIMTYTSHSNNFKRIPKRWQCWNLTCFMSLALHEGKRLTWMWFRIMCSNLMYQVIMWMWTWKQSKKKMASTRDSGKEKHFSVFLFIVFPIQLLLSCQSFLPM